MMEDLRALTSADLPRIPRRPIDAFKTSAGSVLVVAGSYGMAGAAYLAASAALRAGAGYVRVATPASVYPILAALVPSAVFVPLDCAEDCVVKPSEIHRILKEAERSEVAVIGPGWSDKPGAASLFYMLMEELRLPKVLDANALGLLGRRKDLFGRLTRDDVLTPHPGEMGDLLDLESAGVQKDRIGSVRRLSELTGAVSVLKGARTLVCDGRRLYCNTSGNAGMAKAGTGDILSGIIGAFIAQGIASFDSAALGVYIHGRAGDSAAHRLGRGLVAEDVAVEIPAAIRRYERGRFETGARRPRGD